MVLSIANTDSFICSQLHDLIHCLTLILLNTNGLIYCLTRIVLFAQLNDFQHSQWLSSSIWPIVETRTSTTTPGQSRVGVMAM